MKKGLTLALLMVAMVALVVPASAKAPIINLPDEIIVGNQEDEHDNAGTTVSLMRYNEAVDVNSVVNWNNAGYTYDKFWMFWADNGVGSTTGAVYDQDSVTTPLTPSELTAMSDGEVVDVTTEISGVPTGYFQGTSLTFSLGLLDSGLHPTLAVPGADPYGASADADGVEIANDYDNDTTLTMVAAVTSGVLGLKTDSDEVRVIFQGNQVDDGGVSATYYDFVNSDEGWIYLDRQLDDVPQAGPDGNGIGFDLDESVTNGYSQWKSPPTWDANVIDGGDAYKVLATLNSDTDDPMGYRFTFNNLGWTHYGEVLVKKDRPAFPTPNFPSSTQDFEARLYFEPPVQLEQMGDADYQANASEASDSDFPALSFTDYRIYTLTFDAIAVSGDTGALQVSAIDVQGYTAPSISASDVEIDFGSAVLATPTSGAPIPMNQQRVWKDDSMNYPGYQGGTFTAGTTINLTLPAAANDQWGITAAINDDSWYTEDISMKPVSNTLYRMQFEASCNDLAICPVYRTSFFTVIADNTNFTSEFGRMSWQENFGGGWSLGVGKQAGYIPPEQPETTPGAPSNNAAEPSIINSYVYSHNVPTASGNDRVVMAASFTVVDTLFSGTITNYSDGSQWDYPSGTVAINYAAWQNLGSGN